MIAVLGFFLISLLVFVIEYFWKQLWEKCSMLKKNVVVTNLLKFTLEFLVMTIGMPNTEI